MNKCYEEGFVGSLYSLQGFGEGITIPIDQEAVIKAIKMTGDDLKLSEKLEGNTKLLKQNVIAEMQRGFASELSYADIARNISNWGNADMNRSKTIARTEGHRVQCRADMDCAYKARESGCDTVKQWNSTLDVNTRESHQKLDKEWQELDEPFSNGLMYPGDPKGKAAEVCNCRCSLDDVPRWYVLKGGGQYRREGITGEIIECSNYAEFKEKYLQIINDKDKIKSTILPLDLQLFSKSAEDYATVILPKAEYAHVMSEIATNLTEEQSKKKVFSKHIGDYIYTVENKGFGEYRVIDKIRIEG